MDEKVYQYMLSLLQGQLDKKEHHELLRHSEAFTNVTGGDYPVIIKGFEKTELFFHVDPDVFRKYFYFIDFFRKEMATFYQKVTGTKISAVDAFPDLDKYQIVHNYIVPAVTPWEEINHLQTKLIEDLRKAGATIDLQNIGNTSRTIMQKVSSIVFDSTKHIPIEGVKVSEGMFKNRIATYIASELNTSQDKELRDYAKAIIESTDKVIDLSNQVTHDLKTKNLYAECCVIGVVTTLSLLRVIDAKRK